MAGCYFPRRPSGPGQASAGPGDTGRTPHTHPPWTPSFSSLGLGASRSPGMSVKSEDPWVSASASGTWGEPSFPVTGQGLQERRPSARGHSRPPSQSLRSGGAAHTGLPTACPRGAGLGWTVSSGATGCAWEHRPAGGPWLPTCPHFQQGLEVPAELASLRGES